MSGKVLLVDDNPMYRQALRRNLELREYEVIEAEDSLTAMQSLVESQPDVMVTDLDMRTRTEGLDLIKQVIQNYPVIPVILISAVGTFDEGALAKEYGALYVVSKGEAGQERESLVKLLEQAIERRKSDEQLLSLLESWRESLPQNQRDDILKKIRTIIDDDHTSQLVKSEAFDTFYSLQESTVTQESRKAIQEVKEKNKANLNLLEIDIDKDLKKYHNLQSESFDSLRTAEFLYRYQESMQGGYDFSRNIGFSYCFAVENETKAKFRHKLPKFLKSATTLELVERMFDRKLKNIDLFFQQQLMRLQQVKGLDFQVDKIKQVLEKLLQHSEYYKPDGLKAMGILILCFGRNYELTYKRGKAEVNNPLGLKGLDDEDDILLLSHQLIQLQHFRNPYIHPEITIREKVTIIRKASLQCLDFVGKLDA